MIKIITICGSMRFINEMERTGKELMRRGYGR